jgi:tetratricopeptide (TPR) repeat protein
LEFAVSVSFPDPEIEANAHLNLADLAITQGRLDEAEQHLTWVERPVRTPAPEDRWALWSYSQHFCHSYGELCLLRGDLERARVLAEECLTRAEKTNRLKNVVKARRLLGQTALASGDLDTAGVHLEAALETAHQIGNPPQLWKTLVSVGDLRRVHGHDASAAYDEATAVIDRVAADLIDEELRGRLLGSDALRTVRSRAE